MKHLAVLLGVCLLPLLAQSADASIRQVSAGENPVLAADEGLLAVDVDSSTYIGTLRIARLGSILGGESIKDIQQGRSIRLFVVTAGEYRWDRIQYFLGSVTLYFDLKDEKEYQFQVRPGVINYPGALVYRPGGGAFASIHASNRGLGAIDWLRANAPSAYGNFRFEFTGHYADPFPEFYRVERASHAGVTDAELDKTLPPPSPGKLPIPVEDLWRGARVQQTSLNPAGDLLAEAVFDKGAWSVDLVDLEAGKTTRLLNGQLGVSRLQWAGAQVLAVTLVGNGSSTVFVVRIGAQTPAGRSHVEIKIPKPGLVLDVLPNDPDHLLFESRADTGSALVHKIDISSPAAFDHQQFGYESRIDRGASEVFGWLADGTGQLRGALAVQGQDAMLLWGANGKFQPILKINSSTQFVPVMLSTDGNLFYGLSDKDRTQRDLVAFDPITRGIVRTVFTKPGKDVVDVKFDAHHKLMGATYFEDGKRVVEYFDEESREVARRAAQAFPGMTTSVRNRDDTGKQFIIAVEGSDRPEQLYHFDLAKGTSSLVEDSAPWLSGKHLVPAQIVHAKGSDGLPIEAYLTLPWNASGKSPLIVYSHGGPIGIRDALEFDPAVQLFASLGYAVLQVNFRGSDGYGRAFREAGEHHYGGLIEDDIDAAIQVALARFPLDPTRLCAVGASYGGYSALASAVRWPKRFRCAVSISGVSDQLLMFTASDAARTESGRKDLVTAIGDPIVDSEAMRKVAPLYRYAELTLPVMLAHGTEDERVDYEHSRRLVRMLNLAGHEPVMLTLDGEGHGGFEPKNELALWIGVAGFLRAQLDAKQAAKN